MISLFSNLIIGCLVPLAGFPAAADPPAIQDLRPAGVQRGEPTRLEIRGEALGANPRLIAPFRFEVEAESASEDAARWRLELTAASETPVGVYPIRVRTDHGISNPFLLAVGQLTQVDDEENNNTIEKAQVIPSPCVVDGRCEGNDVDVFRFPGRAGERVVVDARCARIGSGLDPTLRLTTASGRFVASDDDTTGLRTDARLVVELPEDGDYLVELSDTQYRGGNRPAYRLVVGPVPLAAEVDPLGGSVGQTVGLELRGGTLGDLEIAAARLDAGWETDRLFPRLPARALGGRFADSVHDIELPHPLVVSARPEFREPRSSAADPLRLVPPVVINGRLSEQSETDRYELVVEPGRQYRVEVEASRIGSGLDGVLRVRRSDGSVIERGDDTTVEIQNKGRGDDALRIDTTDPALNFQTPEDVSVVGIELRDLSHRGGVGFPYRIRVEPLEPALEVELLATEANVPRGGTRNLPINVVRTGLDGPITLRAVGLPDGLSAMEGSVPRGRSNGVVSLRADADHEFDIGHIQIYAMDGENLLATGERAVVFASVSGVPTHVRPQRGVVVAAAPPLPLSIEPKVGSKPVELVHGFATAVPLELRRSEGASGKLMIEPLPLPDGFAVEPVEIAADASSATLTVAASREAPLGPASVAFRAKGTVGGGRDVAIDIPLVTFEVVRPVALELGADTLALEAGSTAELQGILIRRGPFDGQATLTLEGLPKGLAAEPITLPGDQSRFTIPITAQPDAPEATATTRVSAAFQLDGGDDPPSTASVEIRVRSAGDN